MSGVNDKTLGAFVRLAHSDGAHRSSQLVGGMVNIFLLGLTLSQQWTYFSSFPEDRDRSSRQWWIVVFLVPFSIGESICCMLTCYHNLVTLNGSPVSLSTSLSLPLFHVAEICPEKVQSTLRCRCALSRL